MNSVEVGKAGEELAVHWLSNLGYEVLERNYTCQFGEIDVVCAKENWLVFVEVRLRRGDHFGSPTESLTCHKRHHLYRAAALYLTSRLGPSGWQNPFRFDFVGIRLQNRRVHLELFPDFLGQEVFW